MRVSVVVRATPADVWAELADIGSHVTWMADAAAIRVVGGGRGAGTTFECDTVIGPFRLTDVMTVTEWRPRRALGVRHVGVVTGTGRFTLRRLGVVRPRTRVTWTESLVFPWWLGGRAGLAVASPVLRLVWRANLRRLRTRIEKYRS